MAISSITTRRAILKGAAVIPAAGFAAPAVAAETEVGCIYTAIQAIKAEISIISPDDDDADAKHDSLYDEVHALQVAMVSAPVVTIRDMAMKADLMRDQMAGCGPFFTSIFEEIDRHISVCSFRDRVAAGRVV